MKNVTFRIRYRTEEKESVQMLCLWQGVREEIMPMIREGADVWGLSLQLPHDISSLVYGYRIVREGKV